MDFIIQYIYLQGFLTDIIILVKLFKNRNSGEKSKKKGSED